MRSLFSFLHNMEIRYKISISFLIMALLVIGTGGLGIWGITKVGTEIAELMRERAAQQKIVLEMVVSLKTCRHNLVESALVINNIDEVVKHETNYRKRSRQVRDYCKVLLEGDPRLGIRTAAPGGLVQTTTKSVLASWEGYEQLSERILSRKKELLKRTRPGVVDQAAKDALADPQLNSLAREELSENSEQVKAEIDDLADILESQMYTAVKDGARITRSTVIGFIATILVATFIASLLGWVSFRGLVKRLNLMIDPIGLGATGDLTATMNISSGDEIGRLAGNFNSMLGKLSAMLWNVSRSSGELAKVSTTISIASHRTVEAAGLQAAAVAEAFSAIEEVRKSVGEVGGDVDTLSQSASETSTSIMEMVTSISQVAQNIDSLSQAVEEVSGSVIEMAASIDQIEDNVQTLMVASTSTALSIGEMDASIVEVREHALETVRISSEALRDAQEGKISVEATMEGMREIRRSSEITASVIRTLTGRAGDIDVILSVIEEVAEQTNLLALNAAIIAAQAGEHGRGFAVVADEIRCLADRTSSSTQEIAVVVKAVQEDTKKAAEALDAAEKRVVTGEQLSANSYQALMKIVNGINDANERITMIAGATQEQATETAMIHNSAEQVREMVSQILRAAKEQGKGNELIRRAVEVMSNLTTQVRQAAQEQTSTSSQIARATENVSQMVLQIKHACDRQRQGSETILKSVEKVRRTTVMNQDTANVVDEAVERLTGQMDSLTKAIGTFRILPLDEPQEKGPAPLLAAPASR